MCSIIGSFDKQKIIDLIELNQHRGNFSYSISLIKDNRMSSQIKAFGQFDHDILDNMPVKDEYILCHVQAPTGGMIQDIERIHPTCDESTSSFLWHNGILVPRCIQELREYLVQTTDFDTELLHKHILTHGFAGLSHIEGLFACAFLNSDGLHVFRTKHGKLYIDDDMNLSSERFEGSKCINYDTVYKVDFKQKNLIITDKFKTMKYHIIVKGEL